MRLFRGYLAAVVLACCAAPALSACGVADIRPPGSIPASPAAVADSTTLDEKGLLGVELAYSVARTLGEFGVDAGLIKGATATKIAELDSKAYGFILLARSAYSLGNRTTYGGALDDARGVIAEILKLAKGGAS